MKTDKGYIKELMEIPGIGKSLAKDLWKLDIHSIEDLKNRNPLLLYQKLNSITGIGQDPCVLYTFRCAVYYATEKHPKPEKLKWWYWKDKRYRET
ncbi:MAG: helix-hairpin-helix domain-containing protein [Chitinophagaceae bacterium]